MNIFTYGSLMFPEVWERVTGLTRPGLPARLTGYAARCLHQLPYPALIPCPASLTHGILYQNVPRSAVHLLDLFEGDFYQRHLLPVTLTPSPGPGSPLAVQGESPATSAWTYLASHPADPAILSDPWDPATFARQHLQTFLRQDPGFASGGRSALDATRQAT